MMRVPRRPGDDEELVRRVVVIVLLVLAAVVAVGLVIEFVWPPASSGASLALYTRAPTRDSYADSCFTFTDSGWVHLSGGPLTDLKDITVYWRGAAGGRDSFLLAVPAVAGDSVPITVNVPEPYGVVSAYARDRSGNESCLGTEYVYALEKQGPAPLPPPDSTAHGLTGRFYTYDRWTDFKAFLGARVDTTIDFYWGAGAIWPGGPADYSSVRWVGNLLVPTSGSWTLYVQHNDGTRLWIDGAKVIDRWLDSNEESSATLWLDAGPHAVTLEYYEGYSSASLRFSWSGPGVPKQVVSKEALTP